jgi:predicted amidohydrolase YtcJ
MKLALYISAFLMLMLSQVHAQRMLPISPEAIYYNGKIVTIDLESHVSEAFAVRAGRILAVGSTDEIQALAGRNTEMVNLMGHTVVPGMIDNHNHQYHLVLLTLRGIDLQNIHSLEEMLERLRLAAETSAPGETIYTRMGGWDIAEFPEQRGPTRQDLDSVSLDHPIFVFESRSRQYVNSATLNTLGITRDTKAPIRLAFGKDESGELNGLINGRGAAALHLSARVVDPPTLDEQKTLITRMQAQQNAMGLTGIRDLQLFPDVMRAYFELWREKAMTMRVSMGLELNAGDEVHLEEMLAPWGVGSGFGDEWLRIDGIAEFNPGNQLREPYSDGDGTDIGTLRLSEENFKQAILTMNRYGWRPTVHAQGDRTLDLVLDAYEAANRERSILDRRWIVEHVPLIHPEQMDRIKQLGVMISAQYQPYTRSRTMLREWGKDRTEMALPMRDILDKGIIVSGGSDWPSFPNNPFLSIYYYVTRNTLDMGPVGVDQKISRMEALRVMTLNNAFLTYEEEIKGSIEAGKLADFVILSADIMSVPEEHIKDIVPLATYVGGRNVYSKPQGGF